MKIGKFSCAVALLVALSACSVAHRADKRETIFDKIVNIPDKLVLDIPQLPPLCDELPGLTKGFVDILGGKLYYEEEGIGIPLVLINGGPGCTHHGFHPYFSQLKDIARVIYYDQRGTGKSSSDDTGKTYNIRQAIEDIESLRKALNIDQWVMFGFSYGGFLAQCYALTYPENIKGLILVSSFHGLKKVTMKPEGAREQMFISSEEKVVIKSVWDARDAGKLTKAQACYNYLISGGWKQSRYYKPTPEEFIELVRRDAFNYEWCPAPGFTELLYADYQDFEGLDGKFDDFEIPTLLLEALWDLHWDNDKVDFMRKNHPHAQVEIFEKSGHMIFVDEPEKFFDVVRAFLKKTNATKIDYKAGNRLTWPASKTDAEIKAVMDKVLQGTTKII